METISVNSNQGSQAYGQEPVASYSQGDFIKATVLEQLDDQLYLLKIGSQSIEAKVAAELQEGQEYQFVVEKGGTPPELSVVTESQNQKTESNGLTPAENKWLNQLLASTNIAGLEISNKDLLSFIQSLGFSLSDIPEEVAVKISKVLELLAQVDSASPAIRHVLGQTLLFSMHQNGAYSESQNMNQIIEMAIKYSGQVPKWPQEHIDLLSQLRDILGNLSSDAKKEIQALLLDFIKKPESQNVLTERLTALLTLANKNSSTSEQSGLTQSKVQAQIQSVLNDVHSRFFLAASLSNNSNSNPLSSNLDRRVAIQSFQQQAPGLSDSSVANLLEQFSSLGGSLEKLNVGDVVSTKLAWKGGTPSALQIHRSGALLQLSQNLNPEMRIFEGNKLINGSPNDPLPVILDSKVASDPSGSSVSLNKLTEFTQAQKLPTSYHIDRLLQVWTNTGRPLTELRPEIDIIQSWNKFIEEFPELRSQLAEHLLKDPAFLGGKTSPLSNPGIAADHVNPQANPAEPTPIPIAAETRSEILTKLRESGVEPQRLPSKYLESVMRAVQETAGAGQAPSKNMLAIATWLIGRNISVTPQSFQALVQFQQGHSELVPMMKEVQQLKAITSHLPQDLKMSIEKLTLELAKDPKSLKDNIQFYQKGNGKNLRDALSHLRDYLQGNPQLKDAPTILAQIQSILTRVAGYEDFLSGLKHYNVQAQRNDTPQLYEIPVSFGDETQKALLKIFKRTQGKKSEDEQSDYKIVIDLDLEGLGKVRSEVGLFNKHLQLDFLSPNQSSIDALKKQSSELGERLELNDLKASMGFKVKKTQTDHFIPELPSVSTEQNKSNIDISA